MNGETTLYNILKNDSGFYSLLSLIEIDPVNNPGVKEKALSIGIHEPTTWGQGDTTASIYNAVGVNNSAHALFTDLTVACRASSEPEVKALAYAAVSAIERYLIPGGAGIFYTFTGGIIPPEDPDTDSYNLPITVTVKAVKETL